MKLHTLREIFITRLLVRTLVYLLENLLCGNYMRLDDMRMRHVYINCFFTAVPALA